MAGERFASKNGSISPGVFDSQIFCTGVAVSDWTPSYLTTVRNTADEIGEIT